MIMNETNSDSMEEEAAVESHPVSCILHLFVAGMTPKSTLAIATVRRFCDEYLAGRHELTVIDIYQQPELAGEYCIIATPTLIRKLPLPLQRLVGDLSDAERFQRLLDFLPPPPGDEP